MAQNRSEKSKKQRNRQSKWRRENDAAFRKKCQDLWEEKKEKEKQNPELREKRLAYNRAYYKRANRAKKQRELRQKNRYLTRLLERDRKQRARDNDGKRVAVKYPHAISPKLLQEIILKDQQRQIEKIKNYKSVSAEEKERRIKKVLFPNQTQKNP